MNEIGVLRIETSRAIYFDSYTQNRATGSFILIDPTTNATVAAGMILAPVARDRAKIAREVAPGRDDRVTPVERILRYRHSGAVVPLGPRPQLAWLLERRLFDRGCAVVTIEHASQETLDALEKAGLLALQVSAVSPDRDWPQDNEQAVVAIVAELEESGVLLAEESLTGGEGI
jgi:hypothetical protein